MFTLYYIHFEITGDPLQSDWLSAVWFIDESHYILLWIASVIYCIMSVSGTKCHPAAHPISLLQGSTPPPPQGGTMFDVCERLVPVLCHCCSYYIAFGVGMKNCALQYEHSLNLFGVFWKGRTSSIFWKFTIWYYSSFFPFNTSLCEQPSLLCPRSLPLGTFRQESRRFFWRNVASGEERGEPRRLFSQAFLLHTPQRLTVKPGQVCVPPQDSINESIIWNESVSRCHN